MYYNNSNITDTIHGDDLLGIEVARAISVRLIPLRLSGRILQNLFLLFIYGNDLK